MKTIGIIGIIWSYVGIIACIWGLYKDNGKEN